MCPSPSAQSRTGNCHPPPDRWSRLDRRPLQGRSWSPAAPTTRLSPTSAPARPRRLVPTASAAQSRDLWQVYLPSRSYSLGSILGRVWSNRRGRLRGGGQRKADEVGCIFLHIGMGMCGILDRYPGVSLKNASQYPGKVNSAKKPFSAVYFHRRAAVVALPF